MKSIIPMAAALLLAIVVSNWGGVIHAQDDQDAPAPPTNVTAVNGANIGEAVVSWDAVADAKYYRIGWIAYPDYEAVSAAGRDWMEAFAFVDVANNGQSSHTLNRLVHGVRYAFIVASNSARYGVPEWSGWATLELTDVPRRQPVCPTPEPMTAP